MTTLATSDRTQFREGMSRLSAAVNVLSTDGEAGRHGFTASAVCSVTDVPPTLLVCINRSVRSHDAFLRNGCLAVNVLAGAHQDLSRAFGDHALDMAARFGVGCWRCGVTGAPLLDGASVVFDCRIADQRSIGSHTVVFCEVAEVHLGLSPAGALIWFDRAYHTLGHSF